MAEQQHTPDPAAVASATELARQTEVLRHVLAELRAGALEVAVADTSHQELVLERFPVVGSKRAIAQRTSTGSDALAVPTAGVLVMEADEARMGGTIVNSGANPVILYLTRSGAAAAGRGAIYLAANGGAWDFRLGNVLWAGSITAVAQTAASTITVAVV